MSSMLWYFAYGSNMQSATLRGRRGIEYRRAVPARLRDWRLVLDKPSFLRDGNTFANVVPEPGAVVCGVSFEVAEEDMSHIDLTEGVLLGNYERVAVTVEPLLDGHAAHTAFTLTSERRHSETRPSPRYMGLLIEGAHEHGLPADYITALRQIPTVDESPRAQEMRALIDTFLRKP